MTIVVTGATGHLGRLVVTSLLEKGVPASEIVATGRDVSKIAGLGVTVKRAPFDDPAALDEAFAGAGKVLLVSGSEVGQRFPQHRTVVDAAKRAGVGQIVYTSAPKASTTDMKLAEEHRLTEDYIQQSGIPYVILRNGWYTENYDVHQAIEHGIVGASGEGQISASPRADYAEAAAAVLAGDGHDGKVYELGGEPFTKAQLAAEISRQSGKDVSYTDLSVEKYAELLEGLGVPAPAAAIFADVDGATSRGALLVDRSDLEALLGRPSTPLSVAVRDALS